MHSILKEEDLTTKVQTESVERLLTHLAQQTKNIDRKLKVIINKHIAQDLQNYYNEVNDALSTLKEKNV